MICGDKHLSHNAGGTCFSACLQGALPLDIILYVFLIAFGAVAGFFVGSSNYGGLLSAIAPGLVIGLLISIPFYKDQMWLPIGILIGAALLGSFIVTVVPDSNGLKRFCREQDNLVLSIGPYKMGRDKGE
jgi:hypothetical protein